MNTIAESLEVLKRLEMLEERMAPFGTEVKHDPTPPNIFTIRARNEGQRGAGLFSRILTAKPRIPNGISPEASDLILKLLVKYPQKRLGGGEGDADLKKATIFKTKFFPFACLLSFNVTRTNTRKRLRRDVYLQRKQQF
jgi:serine/threonine protein kinase